MVLSALALTAAPAQAQTTLSSTFGIATENVGRGISYSKEMTAPFANATLRHGQFELAGAVVRVSGGGANYEASIAARHVLELGDFKIRTQVERTMYPGAHTNTDYWEYGVTARRDWEDAFAQVAVRHSPDDSRGAQYVFLDAGHRIASLPFGDLSARGRLGWRPYDDNPAAGLPDYFHWNLGLDFTAGPIAFDITYHDTDLGPGTSFPSDQRIVGRMSYRLEHEWR
jgi:hypothetical protein